MAVAVATARRTALGSLCGTFATSADLVPLTLTAKTPRAAMSTITNAPHQLVTVELISDTM